ncbi:hypothetical protein ALT_1430 [Aspergillus lentulus]|uniref:EKC/KEOPS complex subunit BUD32 n=1 Tax=Aspergillus lentulus TaxID=293939 RepID=A0AAN4PCB3_ASPLE|nr:hypothetical protein ALT_1430 [Aspergillus lentulus]
MEDKLFPPDYRHQHHRAKVCSTCADCTDLADPVCQRALEATCAELECDNTQLVQRTRRNQSYFPTVHIGLIASGDSVIKSGVHRDAISQEAGIIGFEMEGAGIWNTVPCVIIKGGCDYADSHKNKLWQEYAAATAAACAKAFPLGMSFTGFRDLLPEKKFPKDLVQRSIQLTLIALAFMHENNVIHTDISSNNILFGIEDPSIFSQIEEDEMTRPIARKVLDDRHIYFSRPLPVSTGLPVISDLGEARVGSGKQRGDIMPGIYRAPEVILDMGWDSKVDIWSMGTMVWDLVESSHLFFAKKDHVLNDEQHLAEMVSLMGPPPQDFLKRSGKCQQFWDMQGNWKGSVPIPEQTLAMRERQYSGEDNALFLTFLQKIFRWLPDERPTAEELAYDDFLMQPLLDPGSKGYM